MEYLYPRAAEHVDTPGIPTLSLPLRVGIAFVPDQPRPGQGGAFIQGSAAPFTQLERMALLTKVQDRFKALPFVQSIELIPQEYLMPRGGFANLDQLRSMFGVDVVVLLSYDQAQFTDEGLLSLTYWTVVGAWVIHGEKNETQTMLDAVVYDIASRKLLFRAPGVSDIKAGSTLVNLSEQIRHDSDLGFDQAATNMMVNLDSQLTLFKERVKASPAEFNVVNKPGYTGAGALGSIDVALIGALGVFAVWIRRSRTA
jgi:rhombotail lipoprotein